MENYLYWLDRHAALNDPITNEDKNRLVYSLLGAEGTARFASNPSASRLSQDTIAEFSVAVKRFFQPPVNPLWAPFDFQHHHQQEGESAAKFLGALRTLLIDCDMQDAEEYQHALAKQLVLGCCNKDTLQKLLAMAELDLDRLYKVMEAEERANANASVLHHSSPSKVASVNTVPSRSSKPLFAQVPYGPTASKPNAKFLAVLRLWRPVAIVGGQATSPRIPTVLRVGNSATTVGKWDILDAAVGVKQPNRRVDRVKQANRSKFHARKHMQWNRQGTHRRGFLAPFS